MGMLVRFWGTRGSLPVAPRARAIEDKLVGALMRASGRTFADEDAARRFVNEELSFGEGHSYGGATTCLEIEGADDSFFILDMGSGLRELGNDAFRRIAQQGRSRTYNFFMSHLHWDHIMGFPSSGRPSIPTRASSSIRAMPIAKQRCAASRRRSASRSPSTGCVRRSSSRCWRRARSTMSTGSTSN
ncbi:hypothetical protein ACFSTI_04000 [Rhizorhabdus histidinilytica]